MVEYCKETCITNSSIEEDLKALRHYHTDDTWIIYSFDKKWIRKLQKLSNRHPDLCVQYHELEEDCAAYFEVAKDIVTISVLDPETGKSIVLKG